MVNVNVIGRLGVDAEILEGKKGKFVKFRMATPDINKGTIWLNVLFSGERALKVVQWLTKGKLISVHGTESVSIYNDKNGTPQVSREINAVDVEFISAGNSGGTQDETSSEGIPEASTGKLAKPTPSPKVVEAQKPTVTDESDEVDDLPF